LQAVSHLWDVFTRVSPGTFVAVYNALWIAYEFQFRFQAGDVAAINALHERVRESSQCVNQTAVFSLNSASKIKLLHSPVLPVLGYYKEFKVLYDEAPNTISKEMGPTHLQRRV
jgi:hypothetical protein